MPSIETSIGETAASADFRPGRLFYRLRRVHEIFLALLLLLFLDWDTTRLIKQACRYLNCVRFGDEVVITLWLLIAAVSFIAGVLMVYQHRRGKTFLPLRSLLTYVFIGGAWWVGMCGFIVEVADLETRILYRQGGLFLCGWGLLSVAIPHLFWRWQHPTPLLFDAVLIMIVFVQLSLIVIDVFFHGRVPTHWPMDWPDGYPIFVIWTMLIWLQLGITRRKPRWLSYTVVLIFNLLIACVVFLPAI